MNDARIIHAKDIREGYALANNEILRNGTPKPSERGATCSLPNVLLVINSPSPQFHELSPHDPLLSERPNETWVIRSEDGRDKTYLERIRSPINQLEAGIDLIKRHPYSRRFSLTISRPEDITSKTSPALMEIYTQVINREVHLTGFFRSVDVYNYLNLNLIGLAEVQRYICKQTGLSAGSIATMMVNAHYYKRDERFVERLEGEYGEMSKHATLIKSNHIPFGWRDTLEFIYNEGFEDQTQWKDRFERKAFARFGHRMLIDIENPLENMIDENATFDETYGNEYAMRYVIGSNKEVPLEDEAYTYASRARFDSKDEKYFGRSTDQLEFVIELLRGKKHTRRAAINISRPWDILSENPACLRAYVFQSLNEDTLGITLFMRSNDAYGATYANQYAFARLAEWVAMHTGFEKVRLTLLAANMHIYADSYDMVENIINPKMPTHRERMGL